MPNPWEVVSEEPVRAGGWDVVSEEPETPKPNALPERFEVSLSRDEQGAPLPSISTKHLLDRYAAPVEPVKRVTPKGPGLKDVEIGLRQGAVGLTKLYAEPAAKIYGGRTASGRTLGEAAEEHLGPAPEDVEARQSTVSKIIQGAARAPLDLAPYIVTPGGPVASMAGVDALRAAGEPDADIRDVVAGGTKGAAMGAALGPLGRYRRIARVPAAGALGAGAVALEGGSPSDVVASGVVMGGLSGIHGKHPKARPEVEPRAPEPLEWAREQDALARQEIGPPAPIEGAPLGSAPKMPLADLMQREGVPVDREASAGPEWWQQQPETRAEKQVRYEKLFTSAEDLGAPKPPEVPETGTPEGVARGMDARERVARQVTGKPWDELTPSERLVVDDLIAEGYVGAGGTSEIPTPAPVELPVRRPAPKLEPKPEIIEKPEPKPTERAADWRVVEETPAPETTNAPEVRTESLPERTTETRAGEPVVAPEVEPVRVEAERAGGAVEPIGEVVARPSDGTAREVLGPVAYRPIEALRSGAKPELDLHREPTGWLRIDSENGALLVHPFEDRVVRFESADARSGTALLRARAEAQAFAVDNPTGTPPPKPAGELVVKPIYSKNGQGSVSAPFKEGDVVVYDGKEYPVSYVHSNGRLTLDNNGRTLRVAESDVRPVAPAPENRSTIEPNAANAERGHAAGESTPVPGPREPVGPVNSGNETEILIPGETTKYRARYAVRELDDVVSSHLGETFQPNPRYQIKNERNYGDSANQERVVLNSLPERFNPAYLITDNPDVTNGPPAIDPQGNVLGGNSRVMILERTYRRNPAGSEAYRKALVDRAAYFGLDPAEVAKMRNPVLVREIPEDTLSQIEGGRASVVRATNKTGTAELTGAERATADARTLNEDLSEYIGKAIENTGPTATLVDALSGRQGLEIINKLTEAGVFTIQEKPRLIDSRTKAVTQYAKDRISKMLLGQFFRDSDQMQRVAPEIRNKLERIAAPLTRLKGHTEWDLIPDVRDAVDLLEYANAHGIKNLDDVLRQQSMFGGPEFTERTVAIADVIRNENPTNLTKIMRQYVSDSVPSMFGEFTPAEAFQHYFEVGAARARIKGRAKELALGEEGTQRWKIDARDFADLVIIGQDYIRQVGRNFDAFAAAMKAEFGERIEPYLMRIYTKARQSMPGPEPPNPMNGGRSGRVADNARDRLVAPGLSLVENGSKQVNTGTAKVIPFKNQRGSLSLKGTGAATPEEIYAKEMVAKREAARKGPMQAFAERVKAAVAKAKAEAVDSTAPILDTLRKAQKEHGYEIRPTANIEYNIDRAYRATSLAEQFVKDNGLDRIIRDVEDIDYLDQYLIAKHTANVEAVKADSLPKGMASATGRDLAKDAALIAAFKDRVAIPAAEGRPAMTYDQVAQRVAEYSNKVLDYSVKSGLVEPKLADALNRIYPDYVPLNRVFNAMEKGSLPTQGTGRAVASLSRQTIVRWLEGSEREIENPLWSLLEKTRHAFEQGERNKAAQTLASYRDLPGFEGLIEPVKSGEQAPAHLSFSALVNGEKQTFRTTPEIAAAAKSLDVHSIGILGQIFGVPGRIMKLGTTGINLPFVVSNVTADQLHTLVTSRYDRSLANPGMFFRALMAALKHDDLWHEVVRQGAGFTSFDQYRGQPKSTIASIRTGRGMKEKADYLVEHPIASVKALFRQAEDIVSRSEEAGRARLYAQTKDRLLKAGRTEADAKILAALEANNALPNYMRAGNKMRPLNAVIPYLNAGVQGVRSFTRAMQKNPVKTSASVATALYFPVAMATLWNLSDPERRKAYRDLQPYELDNNIVILMDGSGKDRQNRYDVLKFKLPPGLNNLTIPLRRAIEAGFGLEPVKWAEVAQSALGSVSPVEPNLRSLGSTLVPQAIKPTVQALANYDFFRGKPKVPGRLQGQPPEMQVHPYTSGTAKKIAGALGTSPIKTEEFIKDTLGGIGSQVLSASDRALYMAGKIPKEDIGGTSTAEAIAARFGKARGGELENREFEARKRLETDAIRRAVDKARKTPYFARLDTEEKQQAYLQTVADRARNEVARGTGTPRYKKLPPDERMAELKKIEARVMRRAVPATITRPVPASRFQSYRFRGNLRSAIPTPAPIE